MRSEEKEPIFWMILTTEIVTTSSDALTVPSDQKNYFRG